MKFRHSRVKQTVLLATAVLCASFLSCKKPEPEKHLDTRKVAAVLSKITSKIRTAIQDLKSEYDNFREGLLLRQLAKDAKYDLLDKDYEVRATAARILMAAAKRGQNIGFAVPNLEDTLTDFQIIGHVYILTPATKALAYHITNGHDSPTTLPILADTLLYYTDTRLDVVSALESAAKSGQVTPLVFPPLVLASSYGGLEVMYLSDGLIDTVIENSE